MVRRAKTTVITDAQMSLEEERRYRTVRYVVMMSIRIVLVLACGAVVVIDPPLLWLWLLLGLVGMAVLPWLAVLLANDRVAKKQPGRFFHRRRRAERLPAPEHPMIEPD